MLKSKLNIKKENGVFKDYRIVNGIFLNINSNSNLYDYDLKRVMKYIYNLEIQRITTIKKTTDLKKLELINLRKQLNIKKKLYIDSLRVIYGDITKQNPLKLYNPNLKKCSYTKVLNDLKGLKIIKQDSYIGYYVILNFYDKVKDSNTFNKLISINDDINHITRLLNHYKDYSKELLNYRFKINTYDLKQLDKGIITQNIKEVYYFYLIKLKKSKGFKHNDLLTFQLSSLNIDLNKALNIIRENLFKENIKSINKNIPVISETLQNNILNKYI